MLDPHYSYIQKMLTAAGITYFTALPHFNLYKIYPRLIIATFFRAYASDPIECQKLLELELESWMGFSPYIKNAQICPILYVFLIWNEQTISIACCPSITNNKWKPPQLKNCPERVKCLGHCRFVIKQMLTSKGQEPMVHVCQNDC